jgi:hypothetical protein
LLNWNQPLGNERLYTKTEKITGARHEAKLRGGPGLEPDAAHPTPKVRQAMGTVKMIGIPDHAWGA